MEVNGDNKVKYCGQVKIQMDKWKLHQSWPTDKGCFNLFFLLENVIYILFITVLGGIPNVAMRPHGALIVLPHWDTMSPIPWPDIPLGHYPDTEPTSPCSILVMPSTKLSHSNYQFYKSLLWLCWDSNSWPSAREGCAQHTGPVTVLTLAFEWVSLICEGALLKGQ